MLKGHIEADEAYVGGRRSGRRHGRGAPGKTIVFGMKERGGRTQALSIPNARMGSIKPIIVGAVEPGSTVSTDEFVSYGLLKDHGFRHGVVQHGTKEYVRIDDDGVKHHTNSVESFWRLFKNSIRSTHIHVSSKYMDFYLGEFTFRANHRQMQNAMFGLLISAV